MAPAHVLSATGLVEQGRVYDLGLVLGADIPQGVEGEFQPYTFRWTHLPDRAVPPGEYQYSAEAITCTPHIGTHINGLAHVASGSSMHGGGSVDELRTDSGFRRYGMETVPPIVTRGTVFDVAGRVADPLPDGYEVTVEDLDACGVSVQPGDTVLVRTGKVREYAVDNQAYQRSQPGVGRDAAIWLYEQGMVALGTDTTGTEPLPFRDATRTTHQAMLVERGVHLIENLYLEELAAEAVQAACSSAFRSASPAPPAPGCGRWRSSEARPAIHAISRRRRPSHPPGIAGGTYTQPRPGSPPSHRPP